jgi:competence protein ComEC
MCFKKKPWARGIVAAVLVLSFVDIGYWIYRVRLEDSLRVTFLDVGKGNSALVEFPKGKKMIIDGGGFSGGNFDVGEMVVAPFLWHSKILTVDYLVLSHPQSDHMNGLLFLARHFHPKEFWYSGDAVDAPVFKDLLRTMKEEAIPAKTPATLKGGTMINGVRVEILHPFPEENSPTERRDGKWLNNRSLVLRISYGRISFLFPGDLESAGEKKLVSRAGERLRSDVLLSPHHGSNTSSSREFLQAVDPGLCVISSGEGNPHFPHQSVLDRLRKAGCKIICTARSGAVEVEAGPENFRVETFVDSRDKQPH